MIERFDVSHHDTAYWEVLSKLWSEKQGFAIVEQDIEVHHGVFKSFSRCDEWWCAFPYEGPGYGTGGETLIVALGCTRFRSGLLEAEPDVMLVAGRANDSSDVSLRGWRRNDARVDGVLRQRGYEPHIHNPPVKHHHIYHGKCACGEDHEEYKMDREGRFTK